ncbi:hypothetical protein EON81_02940 [bacterium]|nr:MAG: hypothetical protein EON81_02940 [bacterium]
MDELEWPSRVFDCGVGPSIVTELSRPIEESYVPHEPLVEALEFAAISLRKKIRALADPEHAQEGWDIPAKGAIGLAEQMVDLIVIHGTHLTPLVTASPEGEVVIEFWKRGKNLVVYVGADQITYVRSWGEDFDDDMAEGSIDEPTGIAPHLDWLQE